MKSSHQDPEYSLILAPEAQADVSDILQFTLEEWGLQQAEKYGAVLDKAFSSIQHSPQIGHKRPDIPPEYQVLQAGQHVIIFRVKKKTIYVVRVLHGSMDFTRHVL